ncbi:MAG: T9SS type A sorting domain-containing protein [Candidatus Kapabacteria bacterium]|nr:T9SS type A sorting domain-containing protein [Ignavibacteriota bacterium]MCW5886255.1 T9SS type A sorting domain-containing protein [Candidatus Kapabacteria bacterium]
MDCPNSEWALEVLVIEWNEFINFCPDIPFGCTITIIFWHRHAQCIHHYQLINAYDVQIKEIYYHENCQSPCLNMKGVEAFYTFALTKLNDWMVEEYDISYDSENPYIYRAVNIPCWFRGIENGVEIIKYCPDVNPQCCWKQYLVKDTYPKYELIDAYIPEGAPSQCYLAPWPCIYICDKDSIFDPPPPNCKQFMHNDLTSDNLDINTLINLEILKNDNYIIEIYDLLGRMILTNSREEKYFLIQLENLKTGVYLYLINDKLKNTKSKGRLLVN